MPIFFARTLVSLAVLLKLKNSWDLYKRSLFWLGLRNYCSEFVYSDMLFSKLDDVSGALFFTMFDGPVLFESSDFSNLKKFAGTTSECIFAT